MSKLIMETVWPNWPTSQLWGIHEDLASDWKHLTVAPLCQRIHLGSAPSPELDRWLTRGSLAERAACIRGLGAHESTQALGVILAHYEQESHSAARQVATSAAVRWLERLENHHEKVAASSVQELRAFLESMARFDPDFGVRSIASGRPESVPTSRFLRYDAKDEWTFDQSGRPLRRRSLSPRWSTYRGQ